MKKHIFALMAVVGLVAGAVPALAQQQDAAKMGPAAAQTMTLKGDWAGAGGNWGDLVLVIPADRSAKGATLQATRVAQFGTDPVPLDELSVTEDAIAFKIHDRSKGPVEAKLVRNQKGEFSGQAWHGRFPIMFRLKE